MVNIDSFVLVIVLVPGFTKRSLWICSPWVFKAGMVWLFVFPVDYLSIYLLASDAISFFKDHNDTRVDVCLVYQTGCNLLLYFGRYVSPVCHESDISVWN